jgi:2-polyprenyl-6-methoxyphenol hydroxylase-like FAD-dependent oxidoreductase
MDAMESTDVLIVGCGPTGALLSTLLGQYCVPNIVLEKDLEINTDPRGIALDEDGIRFLQACGIYDKIFTDIGMCPGKMNFIGDQHSDLYHKPFLTFNYYTTEGGRGHPGFIFHKQPAIEKHLRSRIAALPSSELRVGSTILSISEDEDWVSATYTDAEGQSRKLRARYLVGCDGKTGFTRKMYLERRGIKLERAGQTAYDELWVALNWKMTLPTPETHPDLPLWKKGYTPQQVYDLFFPLDFRFLCNPRRAAVCGRFGLSSDMLWRFEFVVLPGEDGTEMSSPEKTKEIVWPYLTHPGSRYGLKENITYPEDCVEVLRCRPFNFSARSCNKWALDRVILCGDAAHVFPPFGGEGIASGFRDAIALAWRLALASPTSSTTLTSRDQAPDYRKLFLPWYSERKQSLDRSLASTIANGNYVTESHPIKAAVRNWSLWAMQKIPSWRRWLELGDRRNGMTRYTWEEGKAMAFLPEMEGGGNFPQVYCARQGKVQFTDDVIFSREKRGLFQLAVLLKSRSEFQDKRKAIAGLDEASQGILRADEATFVVQQTETNSTGGTENNRIYRLATAEEFAQDQGLCSGRPYPHGYDPLRMWKEAGGKHFVILRPDRFVFAAAGSRKELFDAVEQLKTLL